MTDTNKLAWAGVALGGAALLLSAYNLTRGRTPPAHHIIRGVTAKPVYHPAHRYGDVLYVSGQIGLKDGKLVSGDVKEQARQSLSNLAAVLSNSGSSLDQVLKATCYLDDMSNYDAFNQVYLEFFKNPNTMPARVCVAVKQLPLGALVEVECTAKFEGK
eukprot:c721_g1_i2.p1 GENE.c721_g1_i2~~c721_g1_i2.p1  ORF type:complete len:159 (+),score=38.48 c721_g1_i2:49-525(+)